MSAQRARPSEAFSAIRVVHRYASISPRKARLVIDLVRGAAVDDAFNILRMTRKRASAMIAKLLRSAVATAGERHDVEAEDLFISRAWVDAGPVRKTWWPRPRGMVARKRHRTSHINLVVESLEAGEGEKARL